MSNPPGPQPRHMLFPPGSSNREIASRLKEALANIQDDSTPAGDIMAISVLCSGGIIVELESEELAAWLHDPTGHTLFESQFDSTVSFRTRTFALVLEYIYRLAMPTSFNMLRLRTNSPPAHWPLYAGSIPRFVAPMSRERLLHSFKWRTPPQ